MSKSQHSKIFKKGALTSAQKQDIAIVCILLLAAAYIAASLYSTLNVGLQTQTAQASTVYKTVDTTALVVRQEHIISSASGVAVSDVEDCEKVVKGGRIALTFSDAQKAAAYSQYAELEEELQYYSDMESQAVGRASDVETLDSDIRQELGDYVCAASVGDTAALQEAMAQLNDSFTRRQILIGRDIDFSAVMRETEQQMQQLNISANQPSGSITADSAGVYSSYTDSLEDAFDYESVESLNAETLEQWMKQAQGAKASEDSAGKLITDFEWYFCALVNCADLEGYENGDTIDAVVSGSENVYTCTIVSGAQAELGQEQTVLVLSCRDMNSETASMRLAGIELRVGEYSGIRMPASAVHVKDGKQGVYALVSSVVKWREAQVLLTDGDQVVLAYDPASENGIKLYDQVIIRGKELRDGEVYN